MENKNSTNEAQEVTLEQLDQVTGGAATLPASVRVPRLAPRLPLQIDFPIGTLRDPGLVLIPARPRLLDSVPADLISLVEKL
jgi:hypothetical protein